MQDRPSGAYLEQSDGTLVPDLNDEAMAARAALDTPATVEEERHDAEE